MKNKIHFTGFSLFALMITFNTTANNPSDSLMIHFFQQTKMEFNLIQAKRSSKISKLSRQLKAVNRTITKISNEEQEQLPVLVNAMLQKEDIQKNIRNAEIAYEVEMSKVRYKKGFDLIKMIYEKTLGLDHHFAALQTHQNIAMLSNPNAFPEFQKAKDVISGRLGKKQKFKLPKVFDSNPFVSMTYSIAASFFGNGDQKNRENELNDIACILDFTVRMNSDLNIIYYETEFLKKTNEALKEECNNLFRDYAKVVGYRISLDECRREDDWETLYELIDAYVLELNGALDDPETAYLIYKKKVDLDFSIDRLLLFLNTYNAFVSQGEKYYQKFQTILNNYSNEKVCKGQLPHQFNDLKKDIDISISKFNEAYNISELRGSKLKDLMYGLSE